MCTLCTLYFHVHIVHIDMHKMCSKLTLTAVVILSEVSEFHLSYFVLQSYRETLTGGTGLKLFYFAKSHNWNIGLKIKNYCQAIISGLLAALYLMKIELSR